jgi:hypothetical protein
MHDRYVIETTRHKGLRLLYKKNDRSGIQPDMVGKVQKILSALEGANGRKTWPWVVILPTPSATSAMKAL